MRSKIKAFKQKKSIKLRILGAKRPRYDFSYALEEIRGNGDGLIQPGERFAVRVTVRNSGIGKSYQTIGMLKNKTGRELFIERGRIQFGPLKPKQFSTGWFYLRIHPYTQRKTIKMQVTLFDAELHTTVRRQIVLPVAPTCPHRVRAPESCASQTSTTYALAHPALVTPPTVEGKTQTTLS